MKQFLHQKLAEGKWFQLSLMEQLGNIGSEVGRAARAEGNDAEHFQNAVARALDLFDLTMEDARWRNRLYEIARSREVFCDAVFGEKQYNASLADLEKYFTQFALAARNNTPTARIQ